MNVSPSNRPIVAVALMIAAGLCGVSMAAAVRHLSAEMHPFVIAFWRNFLGAVVLVPWLSHYGPGIMRTRRLGTHMTRAALSVVSMLMSFTAVAMIPLAEYVAMDFLTPVFAMLFGILFFGEKGSWSRWGALAVGFAGVLAITRPGFVAFNVGLLYMLGATGIWGVTLPLIHSLGRTEKALTTTLLAALLMSASGLVPALFVWTWPSLEACLWLLFLGAAGSLGQVALSQSLIMAETGAVAPAEFLKLVSAAGLGYFLFDEIPEIWTWLGGALIVLSGFLLVQGERRDSARR